MSAGSPAKRPDPTAIREALDVGSGDEGDAGVDPGELLVLARRCPTCSSRVNVRVTAALRELRNTLTVKSDRGGDRTHDLRIIGLRRIRIPHHPGVSGIFGERVTPCDTL